MGGLLKKRHLTSVSFVLFHSDNAFLLFRDKNAEELEAYYKKKFAETSDRLVF